MRRASVGGSEIPLGEKTVLVFVATVSWSKVSVCALSVVLCASRCAMLGLVYIYIYAGTMSPTTPPSSSAQQAARAKNTITACKGTISECLETK